MQEIKANLKDTHSLYVSRHVHIIKYWQNTLIRIMLFLKVKVYTQPVVNQFLKWEDMIGLQICKNVF